MALPLCFKEAYFIRLLGIKMYNFIETTFFLIDFLFFSVSLFIIGFFGIILTRKNIILIIVSLEIMLLAVNLNFIFFSVFLDDLLGQIFSLYILTVAGAESAIGLAILIVFYKIRQVIAIDYISSLKG